MSTVPEVIAARHAVRLSLPRTLRGYIESDAFLKQGMKVLVLSLVTNIVVATPYRYAEDAVDAELNGATAEEEEKEDEVANHQEVGSVS
jgi:hypothetical protein